MDVALSILALLLSLLGIIGAIMPIPGVVFSYLGLVCAYFCSYSTLTPRVLIVWAVVSIIVSVVDFLLPPYFAKRFGGSRYGIIGSTVGIFAGFLFFPPVGIILGPLFGAVLGELLHDKSDIDKAIKVGLASLLSFLFGVGIKLVATVWMLSIFLQNIITYISNL